MIDRPDAAELLEAMARTLSEVVLPETSGGTRHAVRVVANLCLILEREVREGPGAAAQTRDELAALLGQDDATLSELVARFDQAVRDGDDAFESTAREVLLRDVTRRLAIDQPGYDS